MRAVLLCDLNLTANMEMHTEYCMHRFIQNSVHWFHLNLNDDLNALLIFDPNIFLCLYDVRWISMSQMLVSPYFYYAFFFIRSMQCIAYCIAFIEPRLHWLHVSVRSSVLKP